MENGKSHSSGAPAGALTIIKYNSLRKISSPEDAKAGRTVYAGHLLADAVLALPTNENVRSYLVDAEGKKTKRKTAVHRAIRNTIETTPDTFSILNGGLVIVARDCNVDDKSRTLSLTRASIINGSQTQGVLRDYFAEMREKGVTPEPFHVSFELIVTDDDDLIAEVSIARNYQNDVMTVSIAGRRGQLDDLEAAIQGAGTAAKLKKSETQRSDEYLDTEKLIQVLTVLTPRALSKDGSDRVYAYNQRTKCLKQFQAVHDKAKEDPSSFEADVYRFYLDVAPQAWALFKKWKTHQGFQGTGLRSIKRGQKREVIEVPDGIVFPIIASFGAFAYERDGKWTIEPPEAFEDDALIEAAKSAYQDIAASKPHLMGKSKACYTNLRQITELYRKLSKGGWSKAK